MNAVLRQTLSPFRHPCGGLKVRINGEACVLRCSGALWVVEHRTLIASDLQRPNAVQQLEIVGANAGVSVWSPQPGNGVGDPVEVARSGVALLGGIESSAPSGAVARNAAGADGQPV